MAYIFSISTNRLLILSYSLSFGSQFRENALFYHFSLATLQGGVLT